MRDALGIGLIGFGLAGRWLHAPLLAPAGCVLRAIVTSRADEVRADFPEAAVCADVDALLARDDVEAVIVASPSGLHTAQAEQALHAGKHVVVDKPFALDAVSARAMIELAKARDLRLTCYQNRRLDSDFLTLKRILEADLLGPVKRFDAHWDRFRPSPRGGWRDSAAPGSGLLLDLGPHLVDQALALFGMPDWVVGDVFRQRDVEGPDDGFEILMAWGARRATLGACVFGAEPRPRFSVFGARGAWVKFGIDLQETHLRAGLSPENEGFGVEPEHQFGRLRIGEGEAVSTPAERGDWLQFYRNFREAVRSGAPLIVAPEDAGRVLDVLDAVQTSAREGRRVELGGAP